MTRLTWQKSSFSSIDGNGECLELAAAREYVAIRESEAPTAVLLARRARVRGLLRAAKAGRFTRLTER
ncbi:DUF397 domain-containing protein [Streptomyces sp. 7-21]|jgi:hypothetical protein|uniref:DUF397 domain-containing protein n=1 Tax=Streptomyces sp. 7-21 TaxID=2802283 RepID=UPI00191FBF98|nr:DUF397 domain-containing protein [Streptomyces sp. 7-21]MBL1065883.1 DUF397 domain-containing protein [Streptomyces sp. 7-21]